MYPPIDVHIFSFWFDCCNSEEDDVWWESYHLELLNWLDTSFAFVRDTTTLSASTEYFVLEMKHDPCFKEIFIDEDFVV